jgi:adenosylcobinamide-phosphate synthase
MRNTGRGSLTRLARAAALGVLADLAFGEPPVAWHPVALFGRLMARVERSIYRDSRGRGALYAAAGVATGACAGVALTSTVLATYLAVGGRMLCDTAEAVAAALSRNDLEAARELLPALVGRDPSELDASGMARAVVESIAENTVDAIVAPVLWATIGGAPLVLVHRALNTMDACVGYPNERYALFGWASARLDDLANFVPARLTALFVAIVRPAAIGAIWRAVREDAPAHPSPNAGVAEAAAAAGLGLRLGGRNSYGGRVEVRPALGHGRPPEVSDIAEAVQLCRHVTLALVAVLLAAEPLAVLAGRLAGAHRSTPRPGATRWS